MCGTMMHDRRTGGAMRETENIRRRERLHALRGELQEMRTLLARIPPKHVAARAALTRRMNDVTEEMHALISRERGVPP